MVVLFYPLIRFARRIGRIIVPSLKNFDDPGEPRCVYPDEHGYIWARRYHVASFYSELDRALIGYIYLRNFASGTVPSTDELLQLVKVVEIALYKDSDSITRHELIRFTVVGPGNVATYITLERHALTVNPEQLSTLGSLTSTSDTVCGHFANASISPRIIALNMATVRRGATYLLPSNYTLIYRSHVPIVNDSKPLSLMQSLVIAQLVSNHEERYRLHTQCYWYAWRIYQVHCLILNIPIPEDVQREHDTLDLELETVSIEPLPSSSAQDAPVPSTDGTPPASSQSSSAPSSVGSTSAEEIKDRFDQRWPEYRSEFQTEYDAASKVYRERDDALAGVKAERESRLKFEAEIEALKAQTEVLKAQTEATKARRLEIEAQNEVLKAKIVDLERSKR